MDNIIKELVRCLRKSFVFVMCFAGIYAVFFHKIADNHTCISLFLAITGGRQVYQYCEHKDKTKNTPPEVTGLLVKKSKCQGKYSFPDTFS